MHASYCHLPTTSATTPVECQHLIVGAWSIIKIVHITMQKSSALQLCPMISLSPEFRQMEEYKRHIYKRHSEVSSVLQKTCEVLKASQGLQIRHLFKAQHSIKHAAISFSNHN